MSLDRTRFFRRAVITILAAAFCCAPFSGCSKAPEPTAEEVEEQHQQHRDYSNREMQETGQR